MTAAPLSAGGVGIKTWIGFVAMAVGMFLAILDTQIVASSLPEIQTGLGIPLSQLSWVQTAYLMAEIVAIPLTGRLTGRAGGRSSTAGPMSSAPISAGTPRSRARCSAETGRANRKPWPNSQPRARSRSS